MVEQLVHHDLREVAAALVAAQAAEREHVLVVDRERPWQPVQRLADFHEPELTGLTEELP
jgi:hypothetical protein